MKGNEPYKGFRIEMTDIDSSGYWALCLGQIDVYGNIYRSNFIPKNGIFKCTQNAKRRGFHEFLSVIE